MDCSGFLNHASAGQLNIEYPMLFSVVSKKTTRQSHCGVLEFVADEGVIYMPHWVRCLPCAAAAAAAAAAGAFRSTWASQMMRNLLLTEGDRVTVRNVSVPVVRQGNVAGDVPLS